MVALPASNTVNAGSRSRPREALLPTLVGVSVLAATLLNFFGSEHYPLLTPEVGLFAAALLMLSLLAGLVYSAAKSIARTFFKCCCCSWPWTSTSTAAIVFAGTAAIAALVNRQLMPFLGIASLIVVATELPGSSSTVAGQRFRTGAAAVPNLDVPLPAACRSHPP